MKKIYTRVTLVAIGAAMIVLGAGSAHAQTVNDQGTTVSLANQIADVNSVVTQVVAIDAGRRVALNSAASELSVISGNARNILTAPLDTSDERASVSGQLQVIAQQLSSMTTIVADLDDVRIGEISLLGLEANKLIGIQSQVTI